jgi:capsular exopolysaccharide synthesis family protein
MAEPTNAGFEADEAPLDLRQYWSTVLRHRWAALLFLIVSIVVVTVFTLRQPKIYQASATVLIDTQAPQVLGSQVQDVVETGSGAYAGKDFYETQFNIIRSRQMAEKVVELLGLDHDDVFLGLDKVADPAQREAMRPKMDPAGAIQGGISVDQVGDSHIVAIHYTDTDPERAARITNAVVEVYVQQNVDRKVEASRSAADWLQNQLSGLKVQLESSENRLYTYKKDHDLVDSSLENKQGLSQQKLTSLFSAVSMVQQHKAELEAKAKAITLAQKSGDPMQLEALPEVAKDGEVATLRGKVVEAQLELDGLQARYGPEWPKVEEVRHRLDALQATYQRTVQRVIITSLNDYKVVANTEDNLLKLLDTAKREAFDVNLKELDYKRLAREGENNQRLYEMVLKRLKEIDLAGVLKSNNVSKLDAAMNPGGPLRPRVRNNIMMGALLGLLGGIVLAFFLEYLDSTISSQEELERLLRIPMLGVLPTIKAGNGADVSERDLYSMRMPKSAVAECCRIIRTNLNFLASERPQKAILVTSSGPQEGKTTTLVNLGLSLAQGGKRVLLVDTDLRRPRLHRSFKLSNDVGLTTLIAEGGALASAVQKTEVPNLFILTSGPVPPNPAELLQTERFKQILAEIESSYDRILFDSPPVGVVSDALVLSSMVNGVLLVLKAFHTDRRMSQHSIKVLRDVKANVLGGVLNNIDLEKKQYGYYQGYYYGYGKYYGEAPSPEAKG